MPVAWFRWSPTEDAAGHVPHDYRHAADAWNPWTRGPGAAQAMLARMERITRQQSDREAILLG